MNRDAAHGIAEAARWRLLGLLLERPRAGWRDEIDALAREVGAPELRAAAEAARAATEGAYLRLLGPGGAVSPREVAYRGLQDPGWGMSDVMRFYEAFAYRPRAEDPPDHVAVEVGFVGYLHLKEGLARASGDDRAAETTRAAREEFLARHLAPVAGAFARRLAAGGSYLATVAALLAACVPPSAEQPAAADPDLGGCGSCPES